MHEHERARRLITGRQGVHVVDAEDLVPGPYEPAVVPHRIVLLRQPVRVARAREVRVNEPPVVLLLVLDYLPVDPRRRPQVVHVAPYLLRQSQGRRNRLMVVRSRARPPFRHPQPFAVRCRERT